MTNELDLLCDVLLHIGEVQENISRITSALHQRGLSHDRTKLQEPEFSAFVSTRDAFKKANYGSSEYMACTEAIRPAIEHHHANNRHHTAYHDNGINDMNLIDICEMMADWKAAARRSPDKTLADSLDYAFAKYNIEPQLQKIIKNTLVALGWV